MPKSKPGPYPWSYSRLKSFETCPRQYEQLKVLYNYKEPETDAIRYGNEFHKAAEDYIASDKPMAAKFQFAMPVMEHLKSTEGDKLAENKMGLTVNRKACGFFEKAKVWYRGICDLIILQGELAYVYDHKTGSNTKYADPGQLELMAISVFAKHPKVMRIRAALLYVVCKEVVKRTYTRDDAEALWAKWQKKYRVMEIAHETGVFNPKPSGLCKKHCIVMSCEHNGRNEL